MRIEFEGKVESQNIDSEKQPYTVVEVFNESNLNYRVFIPGDAFKVGSRVNVVVETPNHKGSAEKSWAFKKIWSFGKPPTLLTFRKPFTKQPKPKPKN